jgi:hypothetical protein
MREQKRRWLQNKSKSVNRTLKWFTYLLGVAELKKKNPPWLRGRGSTTEPLHSTPVPLRQLAAVHCQTPHSAGMAFFLRKANTRALSPWVCASQ